MDRALRFLRSHLAGMRRWKEGGRVDVESVRAFGPIEWRWLSVAQLRRLLPKLEVGELSTLIGYMRRRVCSELIMAEMLHRVRSVEQGQEVLESALRCFPHRYLADLIQRADPDFLSRYAHLFQDEMRCRILVAAISSASDPLLWREKVAAFLQGLRAMSRRGEEILGLFAHFGAEQLAAPFESLDLEESASLIFPPEEAAIASDLRKRIVQCEEGLALVKERICLRHGALLQIEEQIELLGEGELTLSTYQELFDTLVRSERAMRSDHERLRRLRQQLFIVRTGLRKAALLFEPSEEILRRLHLFLQLQLVGEQLLRSPLRLPFEEFEEKGRGMRLELIALERTQRAISSLLTGKAVLVREAREDEVPPRTVHHRVTLQNRLEAKAAHLDRPGEADEEGWVLPLWDALSQLRPEGGIHALLRSEEHRLTLTLLRGFVRDRDDLRRLGVRRFGDLRSAVEQRVYEMVTALFPITKEEWCHLPWEMVGCNFKQPSDLRAAGITTLADLLLFCKERVLELIAHLCPDEAALEESGLTWPTLARVVYCEAHVEDLLTLDELCSQAARPAELGA